MAEVNPPFVLEQREDHVATTYRQMLAAFIPDGGVVDDGDLEVTELPTPAMRVRAAAGEVFVAGGEASAQGTYHAHNDAAVDLDIAAADSTNDRIDLVVARVLDSFYSGGDDEWDLHVVTGTAAATPEEPSVPDNATVLAQVDVPANATEITNADITDRRAVARLRALLLTGQDLPVPVDPGNIATKEYVDDAGVLIADESDTSAVEIPCVWDGTFWRLRVEMIGSVSDPGLVRYQMGSGSLITTSDYRWHSIQRQGDGTENPQRDEDVTGSGPYWRQEHNIATMEIFPADGSDNPMVIGQGYANTGASASASHRLSEFGGLLNTNPGALDRLSIFRTVSPETITGRVRVWGYAA